MPITNNWNILHINQEFQQILHKPSIIASGGIKTYKTFYGVKISKTGKLKETNITVKKWIFLSRLFQVITFMLKTSCEYKTFQQ